MQCVYLENAKYLKDYQIFLEFNDGKKRESGFKRYYP